MGVINGGGIGGTRRPVPSLPFFPFHLLRLFPYSLPRATRGDSSASAKKKIGREVLSCCRRRTMIIHCQGEDTPLRPKSDSGPSSASLGRGLGRRLVQATGSVTLQKDGDVVRKAVMMIVHTLSSCSNCRQRISAIRTRSSRLEKLCGKSLPAYYCRSSGALRPATVRVVSDNYFRF